MDDNEQRRHRSEYLRVKKLRARLKEAGVLTFTCKFAPPIGDALCKAAELANMYPGQLIEVIVLKHFERVLSGQKRNVAPHARAQHPEGTENGRP